MFAPLCPSSVASPPDFSLSIWLSFLRLAGQRTLPMHTAAAFIREFDPDGHHEVRLHVLSCVLGRVRVTASPGPAFSLFDFVFL